MKTVALNNYFYYYCQKKMKKVNTNFSNILVSVVTVVVVGIICVHRR